jgi:arylsulfatase A-like enzyme
MIWNSLLWIGSLFLGCADAPEQAPVPAAPVAPSAAPLNFLVIDIDSLRFDRVMDPSLAPTLHGLAETGINFRDAQAPSGWTLPSLAGLLTGRHPPALNRQESAGWLPANVPTIPELLGTQGYSAAALWGQTLPASSEEFTHRTGTRLGPSQASNRAADWLLHDAREPFFLLLHEMDLHHSLPPAPSEALHRDLAPVEGCDFPELSTLQARLEASMADREEARAHTVAHYDGQLRYYDSLVQEVLAALESSGLAERTVVVLTSNHGEALFEHGRLGHGAQHTQDVLHVPLVIRVPGVPAAVVTAPVELLDLAPTLLDLAGASPVAAMEGRSLRPLWTSGAWPERDRFALTNREAASIRSGNLKLILQARGCTGPKSTSPGLGVPTCTRIHDLATDPGEQRNLASHPPEAAAGLEQKLLDWIKDRPTLIAPGGDKRLKEALKEQGYWKAPGTETEADAGGPAIPPSRSSQ